MEAAPVGLLASAVSMRWPPLAPKKESGCRRLSRKELSTAAVLRFWRIL